MKKFYLFLVLSCLSFAGYSTTWYSQGTGDPSVLSNWNSVSGGGGSTPTNFTTAGDNFIMQTNMTSSSSWTMATAGLPGGTSMNTLTIQGVTWTLNSATFNIGNLIITGASYMNGGGGEYFYIYGNYTLSGTSYWVNPPSENFLYFENASATAANPQNITMTSTSTAGNWTYYYNYSTFASLTANANLFDASDQWYGYGVLNCGPYTFNSTSTTINFYSGSTLYTGLAGGVNSVFTATGASYNTGMSFGFNGTVAQATGTNMLTTVASPGKLIINNTSASGVTLSQSTTITNTTGGLTLTSGILNTGTNTLTVPGVAAAVTGGGATSYVNGNYIKTISGNTIINYEVGDADYAPMQLTLSAAGTAGSIGVKATGGIFSAAGSSGFGLSNMVNHYWTVTNSSAAGPATVTPKVTYGLADILGGSNTGFATQEYNGTSWLTTAIASTNTSSPYTTAANTGVSLATVAGTYIFGAQVPYAVATPSSLSFGIVAVGSSTLLSTSLAGGNLTGGALTVTAPASWQVSNSSTGPWGGTATYTYTGSSLAASPLYVQFSPTVAATYTGSVTVTGGGIASPYNIPITATVLPACSGAPTAGTVNATPASGSSVTPITLSLVGTSSVAGLTYQWQVSSTLAGPYVNIYGATNATFTFTGLGANTYFQCIVGCSLTSTSATTAPLLVTFSGVAASSCIPNAYYHTITYYSTYYCGTTGNPVIITGAAGGGSISDASVVCSGTGGSPMYYSNTSQSVTFYPGASGYSCTMGSTSNAYMTGSIWIDFNDNGIFETSELVGGYINTNGTSTGVRQNPTITIPATVGAGTHRMRVETNYDGGEGPGLDNPYYPSYPQMNPCPSSTAYQVYGDVRDYTAIIGAPPASVTATPSPLAFGNVTVGTSSVPAQYFTVSGSGLSVSALTITPPVGYAVSLNGSTWVSNPSTLTLGYTPGYPTSSLSPTQVYVEFNPGTTGPIGGNIAITGGNLSAAVNVAVTGTGIATACSGTPAPGTANVSPGSGGATTLFTLSLPSLSASGGYLYQWQSSVSPFTSWTNIAGGIYATYSFTGIAATTEYRCIVTCLTGEVSTTSGTATATYVPTAMAASSCTPTCVNATSVSSYPFTVVSSNHAFTLTGASGTGTSINDAVNNSGTTAYYNQTGSYGCTLAPGTSYTCVMSSPTTAYGMSDQIWIDFNNDGIFQTSEVVGGSSYTGGSTFHNETITIPATATAGIYRMRVINAYAGDPSSYPNIPPCPTANTSAAGYMYYCETRDYAITILGGLPPCSGTPNGGIMSAAPTASCSSFTSNVFNVGETTGAGVTYQWQQATSPTGPFTDISGATNAAFTPTLTAVGAVYYQDSVGCSNSGLHANSIPGVLVYNGPPTITGSALVCAGLTTTLNATPTGGTWSSATPANAAIGTGSGIVSGINPASTSVVTYTAPTTCTANVTVTVNTNPAIPGGATSVCASTTGTLTDGTGSGTWASANTAVATVVSGSGSITGVSAGTSNVTFTLGSNGCQSSAVVTVNAAAAIAGSPSVCLGFTGSLSASIAGGTWSSSNTGVATINSSGVVTSVSLGSTTINYITPGTGCVASITFNVTTPPATFAMTGGGTYCSGSPSVYVGVNGSGPGVAYELYNTLTGPVASFTAGPLGGAFEFGVEPAGSYYAVAAAGTACAATMTGTVTVTALPLPTAYAVTGGGGYCPGGTGVNVFLNNSTIGINYQLFVGVIPVGSTVPGTGAPINFGLQTTTGTYTVVATNPITGCTNTMTGSAVVSVYTPPLTQTVTGGGNYCVGGTGYAIGLLSSVSGTNYQLTLGGVPVGSAVAGTGSAISFGVITAAGVYNVVATQTSTGCSATMSGTATIVVNPLPTVFTVTGGGGYCSGTTNGVPVGLNGSTVGVNYQLYFTASGGSPVAVGSQVPGTGVALAFTSGTGTGGTYITAGSYSVSAINPITLCSSNMFGSVAVSVNPLPAVSSVTGGGNYCAGGSGVVVGLSSSTVGQTYSLFNGATLVSAASGTGSSFNFGSGPFTGAGTYTATSTITATGCSTNMAGSVIINIIPLPNVNTVGGGGAYCTGTSPTGVSITLSASSTGINYNLYNGGSLVSTIAGTGSPLSFNNVSAGSYTVVAVTTTTPVCTSNMTGSIIVNANTLPTLYSVTGGGNYCANAIPAGVHVGLSSSNTGINYSLYKVGGAVVTTMAGVGGALDFGLQTTTSTTTYKIAAVNTATGCADTMSGSAVVGLNALPNATYFVTASGGTPSGAQYCFGGTGVNIGTSSSDAGINYQLASGGVPTSAILPGVTGTALNFGPVTGAGPYTVIATNSTTSCSTLITGSITVTINAVPPPFSVTGGGAYCGGALGTTGSLVGLTSSTSGINYQIFNGSAPGATMLGTGSALNFGLEPAGNYTIVATNPVTTCSSVMSGSASVTASAVPASSYIVTGGGAYCTGGTGVAIGLSSSSPGVYYQLMLGGAPVGGGPVAGTGIALSFGSTFTINGSYYVIGTNATTGCSAGMTGSVTVTPSTLPTPHTVNGGGNYCPAGTGVVIGLNGSNAGTTYQLYNGSTLVPGALITGSGSPINFGLQTATGTYTVVAYDGCTGTMTGSATVGVYPLPVAYDVTGGGNYCPGGTGVNVGLSGSATGLTYTLQNGAGPVASMTGTGFSLNFTGVTASGTYTIIASNPATSCSSNMTGTANVVINTPPTAFNVTGGGNYCVAGSGVLVGLDGSVTGTEYQLFGSAGPVGSPVHGTGSAISFGLQTTAGNYTVVATSLSTTCTNAMSGSATIGIIPLPLVQSVSTGGNYCAGGAGIDVTLGSSQLGVTYQLYNGAIAVPGGSITGSGAGLNFGFQAAAGIYTVVGTQGSCSNTMSGSSVIVVDPLPVAYTVGGGGNYCSGGAGLHVVLSGSNTGITYQLMNSGVSVGSPVPGIGSALDFGLQTAAGSYTVVATNTATSCTNTMTGEVPITINAAPNPYTVTSSASNYCAGGAGVDIQLSGSDAGIQYQLYNGSTTLGVPVMGTGFDINFGLQTLAGTYTVVATNPGSACSSNMTSGATILINPLPTAYTVVGGGNYCSGGTGVHVGLSSSNTGISYQLYIGGGIAVGSAMMGTGLALDFGAQTNSGTYTVVATNMGTTCTNNMAGSATITIASLPTVNTVTGGGAYCAGGAGVHIGLNGSTGGVVYQLYNGSSLVGAPVAGTGIALDFGLQTAAGTYTVMGLNSTTACSSNMAGSTTVTINSLPSAFAVTGGGNYCPSASGVAVGLGGSAIGISYQLYNGSAPSGGAILGTGASINFGLETAGTYTAVATNSATGCSSNMSGTISVGLNPLPGVYSVLGGGNYCAGGTGVHVGLTGSATGINYQLFNTSGSTGFPVAGTGGPIDFGPQTVAGVYTVVATNGTTGCTNNMAGSTTVVVNSLVSPSVTVSTGVGDTICNGRIVTISTTVGNGGSAPVFSWSINGSPVSGSGSSYSYVPADRDVVGVSMTSNATCATPATVGNSVTLSVWANGNPTISIAATPGQTVCQGTPVTFNNDNTFGGTPTFTWIVNGSNVSSASSETYVPANGDVVYCIMTSNYLCRLENTVTSNHITMEVDDSLLPTITLKAYPGVDFTLGESVTVTASVLNGGATPSYQWFVNGVPVPGANAASYTSSNFASGDSVTCLVTASGGCTGLSAFNSIRLEGSTGVSQVAMNNSNIQLVPNPNNGVFTIKGTLGTTNDEEVSVEISDMLGQVIYKDKVMVHGGNIDQKVQLSSSIANGMYILNLSSASANNVFHVVIEQ